MTVLVSIREDGEYSHLRRYETGAKGRALCTHEGDYRAAGINVANIEYYRLAGAAQDRIGHRDYTGPAAAVR